MQLARIDDYAFSREATINKNFSMGIEWVRKAAWEDGDTKVSVEVIAYVSGIRARKNPDGSVDLLDQTSKFHVLGEGEFIQPVERAAFIWRRRRPGSDGQMIEEEEVDYTNEIGLFYQPTKEAALENAKAWLNDLDFRFSLDPTAWEVADIG